VRTCLVSILISSTDFADSNTDPEPPEEREWHDLQDGAKPATDAETFKALTYNILADGNVNRTMYGYVPDRVLAWQNRRAIILDEITHADADIVCLQELDREAYDEYFRGNLSKSGYQSYYAQRGRADTAGDRATKIDGCGTFWKDKKYIALDKQSIHLGRKAVERPGVKASADMVNRVFMKDHIATVVLLENRMTGSRMIVVNTHVFWDPAYKDVKLIQVAVLLEEVTRLSKLYTEKAPCTNKKLWSFTDADDDAPSTPAQEPGPSLSYELGSQIPMIICGDFNSGYDSAVWKLMTQRRLQPEHPDFAGYNYNYFTQKGMEHSFTMKSAYGDTREAVKNSLQFTNYVPGFSDVLDYIWYSSNTLRVTGLLGKIDEDYLSKVPGFPNAHFPSDHLALVAEFVVPSRKTAVPVDKHEADFGPSSRK
jgi:CCR4-NOT transcription complex subunit 6